MERQEIIGKSDSPYNSPLLILKKKDDAEGKKRWRVVIDFRDINEKTTNGSVEDSRTYVTSRKM